MYIYIYYNVFICLYIYMLVISIIYYSIDLFLTHRASEEQLCLMLLREAGELPATWAAGENDDEPLGFDGFHGI